MTDPFTPTKIVLGYPPCAFRIPKFGECIQQAVWLIDDGMGTTVPACNWHVGALLSDEGENLVYRVELPMSGVEGEEDGRVRDAGPGLIDDQNRPVRAAAGPRRDQ